MNTAVISLLIFAVCVVLFVMNRLPAAVVALLGLCAMILFGCCSFADGFSNFGSTTVILICSMMVVGRAAFDTGLASVLGNKVISAVKGNERLVIIFGTFITAAVSAVLSNIATLAIMLSVLKSTCDTNEEIKYKNVVMPVSAAAVIGGSATLVGSTTQLTGQAIFESFVGDGNGFKFGTFLIPASALIVLLCLYNGFVGYPIGKRIWGKSTDYELLSDETDGNADDTKSAGQMTCDKVSCADRSKQIIMVVIFALTIMLFAMSDLIKKILPEFNIAYVSVLSALACVLTGCISHKNALKAINWDLAVWFCASLGIADGLNTGGGGRLLAEKLLELLGDDITPFVLLLASVVFVTLLTQFLSNSTVLAITMPVILPLCSELSFNMFPFAAGMTMAAAIAISTPLANTTIGMSMVAKYRFRDYFLYYGPATAVFTAVILIAVPLLWPLVK